MSGGGAWLAVLATRDVARAAARAAAAADAPGLLPVVAPVAGGGVAEDVRVLPRAAGIPDALRALAAAAVADGAAHVVLVDEAVAPAPGLGRALLAATPPGGALLVPATATRGDAWLVAAHARHGGEGYTAGLDGALVAPADALAAALADLADAPRPLLLARVAQLLAARGVPVGALVRPLARDDAPTADALATALGALGAGTRGGGGPLPTTPRAEGATRLLLALGVPPSAAARLDPVLGRGPLAHGWWQARVAHAWWRGVPARARRARLRPVPILMYHGFVREQGEATRWLLPERRLAAHLRVLRLLRRRTLTLGELAERWRHGEPAPPRAVVVTIDDGLASVGALAAPRFRRARVRPSLYVVTGMIGGTVAWDAEDMVGLPLLDAAGVGALAAAGWEIGPHTRTHRRLADLTDAEAAAEIAGSADDVAGLVGPPRSLAYPHGSHDARSADAARGRGLAAVTTAHGRARLGDDLARLPRIEVTGTTGALRVALAVLLGRQCRVR